MFGNDIAAFFFILFNAGVIALPFLQHSFELF